MASEGQVNEPVVIFWLRHERYEPRRFEVPWTDASTTVYLQHEGQTVRGVCLSPGFFSVWTNARGGEA